jgi:hypothetical protein
LIYQPAKKIVFVFLVFTLISSLSAVVFVTGNNLAFAKKRDDSSSGGGDSGGGGGSSSGGGDSGGGGGSSSGGDGSSDSSSSSSNDKGSGNDGSGEQQGADSVDSSGSGTTSDANNDNSAPPLIDNTNNAPPPVTPDNTGTGNQIQGLTVQQQQQEQEKQQCPTGQHFDVNQNACVNDTVPPASQKMNDNCLRQPGTHWDESQGQCVPDSLPNLPPSVLLENNNLATLPAQQPAKQTNDNCLRQPGTHWDESQGQCVPDTTGMDPNVAKATNTPNIVGSVQTLPPTKAFSPRNIGSDIDRNVAKATNTPNAAGSVLSSPLQQSGGPISTTTPPISSSLPECVPGYHWDSSQQQCVANPHADSTTSQVPKNNIPASALETRNNNNPDTLDQQSIEGILILQHRLDNTACSSFTLSSSDVTVRLSSCISVSFSFNSLANEEISFLLWIDA